MSGNEAPSDEEISFKVESAAPKSPSKPAALGTPSNTPQTNLFPKSASGGGGAKRGFDDMSKETAQMSEAMNRLSVANAPPASKPAPKGKGEPALKDDDEEEEGDEEEEEDDEGGEEEEEEEEDDFVYVAYPEERAAVRPLLSENQDELYLLDAEYLRERFALETKFQDKRAPLYAKRRALVSGEPGKALAGFWLDTMKRSFLIKEFIEEHDEPALGLVQNIEMRDIEEAGLFGFELEFTFHPENPFFTNRTLSKRILCQNMYGASQPDLRIAKGTDIKWVAGKKLTVTYEEKTVRSGSRRGGRGGGKPQTVRKEVPQPSFFTFFDSREEPSDEQVETMPDDVVQVLDQMLYADFLIAFAFRTKIVPRAFVWYDGQAVDSDAEQAEEEDEEEEDEEDEGEEDDALDDEEEDDDEEEEEMEKPKRKGKAKGGPSSSAGADKKAAAAPGGEQPECKQQ